MPPTPYVKFLEQYARKTPSSSGSTAQYDVGDGDLKNTFFTFSFPDSSDARPQEASVQLSMLRWDMENSKGDYEVLFQLPFDLATKLWDVSHYKRQRHRTVNCRIVRDGHTDVEYRDRPQPRQVRPSRQDRGREHQGLPR